MTDEVMILKASSTGESAAVTDCMKEFISFGVDVNDGISYSGLSYDFSYIRESDGIVVGLLAIRPEGGEVGHLGFAVRPTEQKKGYGKMLVEQALSLCEMLEIPEVTAVTREDNTASICVLTANGFKEYGRGVLAGKNIIRFIHRG